MKVILSRKGFDSSYGGFPSIILPKEMGRKIRIWLTENRTLDILGTAYNFYGQCVMFPQICPINNSTLVNVNHIKSK